MLLKNSLLISIAFFISFNLSGQEQMERLYRSDRQNTALDIAQTSDEGYMILSAGKDLGATDFDYYTIIRLSNKGDFLWAKDYEFEEKVINGGSLHLLEEDSFLVYGALLNMPKSRFLMKGDPAGNVVWTRGLENNNVDNNTFVFNTPLELSYQNGYIVGGVDGKLLAGTSESWVSELDSTGTVLWTKYYSNPDYDLLNIINAKSTRDSGLIACGFVATNLASPADMCLIKTDSLGEILWSRKYGEVAVNEGGSAVIQTPDDGYLLGGTIANNLGILIKTDTLGLELWSRNIDFEIPNTTTYIHEIIMAADGNAVVAGTLFGANDNFAFMIKFDPADGDVVWKRKYRASTEDFQPNGLSEAPSGGFVFVTTSEENGEHAGPHLIKTNAAGEVLTCDTTIMEDLLVATTVTVDTLLNIATTENVVNLDVTVADTLNYSMDIPNVTLESFGPFCPDEDFDVTFDATIDGALSYEWSTEETTPMITVSDFGSYMVTITMGVDYCYELCPSSAINEKPLPTVEIGVNQAPYCTEGFVNLSANATDTDSYLWSNAENTQVIQVENNGAYSVTATNECGDAEADIDLVISTTPPTVEIVPSGDFCTEGQQTLTGNISGDVNGILWTPNGEATNSIVITQPGNYSLEIITTYCGNNMDDYSLDPMPPTIQINPIGDICEFGVETQLLVASATGPVNGILWSTDEFTDTIEVMAQGIYTVTALTDFCGESTANVEIDCPLNVQVPNVFTPNGDDVNDVFQPYFEFPTSDFVEYRLIVYSRWGEKVFETTDPDEGWDGMHKDELAVSDVYIWTLEGRTRQGKEIDKDLAGKTARSGDVTLMR